MIGNIGIKELTVNLKFLPNLTALSLESILYYLKDNILKDEGLKTLCTGLSVVTKLTMLGLDSIIIIIR